MTRAAVRLAGVSSSEVTGVCSLSNSVTVVIFSVGRGLQRDRDNRNQRPLKSSMIEIPRVLSLDETLKLDFCSKKSGFDYRDGDHRNAMQKSLLTV